MRRADFKIGMRFKTAAGEFEVTDIGWRVVVAIPVKPGWMNGPPYALAEEVFDEEDQKACEPV